MFAPYIVYINNVSEYMTVIRYSFILCLVGTSKLTRISLMLCSGTGDLDAQ